MSLHFLGIRDFPVLHSQFSSPPSKEGVYTASLESVQSPELAQDSKDVLVERLQDLASRLLTEDNLKDEDVTALHVDVDRMERVIQHSRSSHEHKMGGSRPGSGLGISSRGHDEELLWGPLSPSRNVTMKSPETPTKDVRPKPPRNLEMSVKKTTLLAGEAEKLFERLSKTVAELQQRKEEAYHIHDLLITRAEQAAQKVIQLQERITELNVFFATTQSELSILRIQLRALEVQGQQYILFGADDDLSQSIRNWKQEWRELDLRTRARKKQCIVDVDDLGERNMLKDDDERTVVNV